jgi:hypothetical protein
MQLRWILPKWPAPKTPIFSIINGFLHADASTGSASGQKILAKIVFLSFGLMYFRATKRKTQGP